MTIVRRYGGVAAIVVATARKGLTLILSFCLFPKVWSWYYPAGATLVLGGLGVASYYKQQQQQQRKGSSSSLSLLSNKISSKHSDVELQELLATSASVNANNNKNDLVDHGEALDKSDHGLRHLHHGSDRGQKSSNRSSNATTTAN